MLPIAVCGMYFPVLHMQAMLKMGIRGLTVSEVRGFGAQGGSTERHGGKHTNSYLFSF